MTIIFQKSQNQIIADRLKAAYKIAESASSKSAFEYLKYCIIDSKPEPKRYIEVARDWQKGLASCILPAVEHAAGIRNDYEGPRNFWLTLPRGHDKTGMLARISSWFLAFSTSAKQCVAAAVDRDQANILLESMKTEAALNPWLNKRLLFMNYRVQGHQGSLLKAVSSDAYSSFGYRSDLMVFDELTHWKDRGLWDAIFSGRHKISRSVLVIITNAGVLGSWQHDILESIKPLHGKSWFLYQVPPGQGLNNWMNDEEVKEAERLLPDSVVKRVLHNYWIDPSENCQFVPAMDISICEQIGKSRGLVRREEGQLGFEYFASVDYAPVKDRTAMAVVHKTKEGDIVVDRLDILQGSKERRVPIARVKEWIDDVRRKFRLEALIVDPYQLEQLSQEYEAIMNVIRFEPRAGKSNYALATSLRTSLCNHNLIWYEGAGLMIRNGKAETFGDELRALVIKSFGYGFRIDTSTNEFDDRSVAVGMAVTHLLEQKNKIVLRLSNCYF